MIFGTRTESDKTANGGRPGVSFRELLMQLREQAATLMHQEVELAKAELTENARKAARHAALATVGGVFAIATLAFAVFSLVAGVCCIVAAASGADPSALIWAAPLITTAVLGVTSAILLAVGVRKLRLEELTPHRTMDSVRETSQWAKSKIN